MKNARNTPTLFDLSDEQRAAVENEASLLVIRAGAGSGKTRVLVRRCERLIAQGVLPEALLVTTFSTAAADEITHRFAASPVAELLGRIWVGTIHAWCWQQLRQHLTIYERYDVLDETGQFLFLSRWWNDLNLEYTGLRLQNDAKIVLTLLSIARLGQVKWKNPGSKTASDILARYRTRMEAERVIDYEEMLTRFRDEMKCEALHAALAEIQHVIVDEAQDVDPVQASILAGLHRKGTHLCLIGDGNQCLFRWRGCSPRILDFALDNGAECKTLRTNWRSTKDVASVADDALAIETGSNHSTPAPTNANPKAATGELRAVHFATVEQEAEWVANDIAQKIGKPDGNGLHLFKLGDFAILGRTNHSLVPFAAALRRLGISCTAGVGQSTLAAPEAQLAIRWMLFLAGSNTVTVKKLHDTLINGLPGVPAANVERACAWSYQMRNQLDILRAEEDNLWLDDNQAGTTDAGGANDPNLDLQRLFQALIGQSGATIESLTDGLLIHRTWAVFSGLIATFDILHSDLPPVRRLAHLAAYLSSPLFAQKGLPGFDEKSQEEAVSLLTIHQSKGREWTSVYLPNLREGHFPTTRSEDESWSSKGVWQILPPHAVPDARRWAGELVDEKYLLYVAITRTKRFFTASWAPNGKQKGASSFFTFFANHPNFVPEEPV